MVAGGSSLVSTEVTSAVYWDSSAVLSALFRDGHSDEAGRRARGAAVHFLSTLAWAEVLRDLMPRLEAFRKAQ